MESSLSTQILGCCFWAMGYLKREAISKCSDRTHVARFPPWDPTLSCLNMMLPCMHCDVTIWLCKSILWLVNTNSQGRLIRTAYLVMPWWSCSTPYLPGPNFQPLNSRQKNISKHYSAPQEKTNIYVHSSRIRKRKDWTCLQFQVEKESEQRTMGPPPLNHLDSKQNLYHVCLHVMTEVICGK